MISVADQAASAGASRGETLSRREAAIPRAVTTRPDGSLTAVMAFIPDNGEQHENE